MKEGKTVVCLYPFEELWINCVHGLSPCLKACSGRLSSDINLGPVYQDVLKRGDFESQIIYPPNLTMKDSYK